MEITGHVSKDSNVITETPETNIQTVPSAHHQHTGTLHTPHTHTHVLVQYTRNDMIGDSVLRL